MTKTTIEDLALFGGPPAFAHCLHVGLPNIGDRGRFLERVNDILDRRCVTTAADLDAAAVEDVLLSIYRPMRSQPVEAMRVTFSLDLLLFRARGS